MFDPVAEIDPQARLNRRQSSAALSARGFPVAEATLATLASRGGGPRFSKFGPRCVYVWADLINWAESRLSAPVNVVGGYRFPNAPVVDLSPLPSGKARRPPPAERCQEEFRGKIDRLQAEIRAAPADL